jgi:ligand-binding SRPBCC domain-containing protein
MPVIKLQTEINAPIGICFDLSRSIDLHVISTYGTGERAIAGRTSGIIEKGETVTWNAKHLGVRQNLTSIITDCDYPTFFADEMVKGAFKRFRHEHKFVQHGTKTMMTDIFEFESPLGVLGRLANRLFLTSYMQHFLLIRNQTIKEFAESDKWKLVLKN